MKEKRNRGLETTINSFVTFEMAASKCDFFKPRKNPEDGVFRNKVPKFVQLFKTKKKHF